MKSGLTAILLVVFGVLIWTQITIFVVPPIGAVPDGRTLVLWRYNVDKGEAKGLNLSFIDTADAVCTRGMGYVNLLCRGMVLGMVATNTTILARLPYSSSLQAIAETRGGGDIVGTFYFLIVCAVAAAAIAGRRDRAGTGFLLGLILGPIGVIIACVLKGNRAECPYCKELVRKDASVCPHCRKDLRSGAGSGSELPARELSAQERAELLRSQREAEQSTQQKTPWAF
jgi:hypothetical protein